MPEYNTGVGEQSRAIDKDVALREDLRPRSIRQAIVSDDALRRLLEAVKNKPREVQEARDRFATAEFDMATYNGDELAKEKVKALQIEAEFEVSLEEDDAGKKKYSNEAQRSAAVARILAKCQPFVDALNEQVAAKRHKAELTLQMAKARNSMSFHIDMSFALGHACDVVAGLSQEDVTTAKVEAVQKVSGILRDAAETMKYYGDALKGSNGI